MLLLAHAQQQIDGELVEAFVFQAALAKRQSIERGAFESLGLFMIVFAEKNPSVFPGFKSTIVLAMLGCLVFYIP